MLSFLSSNLDNKLYPHKQLSLHLEVGYSSPLSDASNCIKTIEDVVAEYLGFNDRIIVTIHVDKYIVNKGSEYMRLRLKGTNKNIDRRKKYVKPKGK